MTILGIIGETDSPRAQDSAAAICGGEIILLHELIETAKALPKILSSIQSIGLQSVLSNLKI